MFVQSKAVTRADHKDGLAIQQRCGGSQTLIQWANGDRQWCQTNDLQYFGEAITLVQPENSQESYYNE